MKGTTARSNDARNGGRNRAQLSAPRVCSGTRPRRVQHRRCTSRLYAAFYPRCLDEVGSDSPAADSGEEYRSDGDLGGLASDDAIDLHGTSLDVDGGRGSVAIFATATSRP